MTLLANPQDRREARFERALAHIGYAHRRRFGFASAMAQAQMAGHSRNEANALYL